MIRITVSPGEEVMESARGAHTLAGAATPSWNR